MATLILAATLVILVGAFGIMFVSGWRFQPLQPRAEPARAGASIEKWSPPLGPGESASSRIKRLAHEVSSLSIAPTNRPDPGKVLQEAKALKDQGQYEEALQRHIWYHNHALEYSPSQAGVRISFALSDWVELGRTYPKARQALLEIRDLDNREFAEGRGHFGLFQEVSGINRYLQTEDDTVALFKDLLKQDPELARRCYLVAEDLLVRKGEYDLCLSLIPDPAERFNSIRREWERSANVPRVNASMAPSLQEFSNRRFVAQTRALIEILVATGHQLEAEQIRLQAVALMDDARLASAVSDAEKKQQK